MCVCVGTKNHSVLPDLPTLVNENILYILHKLKKKQLSDLSCLFTLSNKNYHSINLPHLCDAACFQMLDLCQTTTAGAVSYLVYAQSKILRDMQISKA